MGKTRLQSRRRQDQGFKWARVSMAILATIGAIDTGSITLSRWGLIQSLSCPGGMEGCDKVLNSVWGTILLGDNFSIPLSFLGLLSYVAILTMAILPLLPGLSKNKTNLSRSTWWGLFVVSCCMTVFSLLLIGLMVFKIKAFCFFCLLSACISVALLVLTFLGGGWENIGDLIFRGILIAIVILLGGLMWASAVDPSTKSSEVKIKGAPPIVRGASTQDNISLAKYLREKGVVMYSAYWCPHCHEQKEMFGKEASAELVVVECASDGANSQASLCEEKGITGYPSWEINGEIESGVRSLKDLADLSGYK